MRKILILLLSFTSFFAGFSQNVGIGVEDPQQKLHVGGNMRVDGIAAPGNAVITANPNGDLLRLNFTGNSNQVLKGDGSFGTINSSNLPAGAIVGSTSSVDSNLLNGGFSFYGEMPFNAYNYIPRPGGVSNQYDMRPTYDKGNPNAIPPPLRRSGFCSVWSGSEMIIWGGITVSDNYTYDFLSDGKKYNPNSDTWSSMSTVNAPPKRGLSSTVWTGTEMIVWGGYDSVTLNNPVGYFFTNTGGKYNPATNSWSSVTQVAAPTARQGAPAVWTGTYMVIWGGANGAGSLSTGSRYNPTNNTWLSTSIVGAPTSEGSNTKMFWDAATGYVIVLGTNNTGGRYNPSNNTWITMANCPVNYDRHSAVWTGSHVMVYSSQNHTMYKYSPVTNTWSSVVTSGNYPGTNISILNAVWTGFEIIYYTYHNDANGNITSNRLYRCNTSTNVFGDYNVVIYNTIITNGNNFLMAGSMVIKWGGEMSQPNYGISEYLQSSQGFRFYLTAGISYPVYYYKSNINNVIYLYRKL